MRRLSVVVLAACGRLGFENSNIGGTGPDASSDGSTSDGTPSDASTARANRVFATTNPFTGSLGGLSGADEICRAAATDVGLPGTFIAALASSTIALDTRLAGSSGWVLVDGTPAIDTAASLFAGKLLSPIILDAAGTLTAQSSAVWTGSSPTGGLTSACSDWMTTSGSGQVGYALAAMPVAFSSATDGCSATHHVYCIEIGFAFPVAPVVQSGRLAFMSTPVDGVGGLAGFDSRCQTDASAAGLSGTFLAAVATKTASLASRFTIDATPWRRVDGTRVSSDGGELFDGSNLASFINQRADGSYIGDERAWVGARSATGTGTVTSTCNDWSNANGGPAEVGAAGRVKTTEMWGNSIFGSNAGCMTMHPVLCLEQ